MATTIRSTALDFNNIKENLKTFLKQQNEFLDYDFEASGLSNILDVLAFNTHINALTANFTLNESYLNTAQLRSSVVSLATGIGYIPASKTSAVALVNVRLNLTGVANRPAKIDLPAYTRFTAKLDDITYVFQTIESFTADDDGTGIYEFKNGDSTSIPIYEGTFKTKTFLVGPFNEADVYIIPDKNLDSKTVAVNIYPNSASTDYTPYIDVVNATSVSENSTIYILKEAPNEYFQLSFGAGGILGQAPTAGNIIMVNYLSTNAADANTARNFVCIDSLNIDSVNYTPSTTTISRAAGGSDKESIESIRRNAPFQYANQNRMVTAEDYTSIILRNYSTLIQDIKSWGGQDNPDPKFGVVYSSILFKDGISDEQIAQTKLNITDLVNQLAILSFGIEYSDPIFTYVETDLFFQVNPRLTPLSVNALKQQVKATVSDYFTETIGGFDKSFRRSNLLSLVDDVSSGILSSRMNVKIQQRIDVTANVRASHSLTFPTVLAAPGYQESVITSTDFLIGNTTCRIQNTLGSTNLEIVAVGTGSIVVDSIGSYNPVKGTVQIISFKPTGLLGGRTYLKISALPGNQSAITPALNNILKYDEEASNITPVLVTADN